MQVPHLQSVVGHHLDLVHLVELPGNFHWKNRVMKSDSVGGGLRLAIRSLALVVIPSDWRATSRGCHTRHRADLCNFVCLCSCLEKRNYSPLIEDEVPAFVSLKKLQFKNKPSCRDHCITARHGRLLRSRTHVGGSTRRRPSSVPGHGLT